MTDEQQRFDQWAIVDVMGHQRYAGRVTEQTIAGDGFVRVDIPSIKGRPAFSKLFAPGAIHSITPCTEEVARIAARDMHVEPITAWDVRNAGKQLVDLPPPEGEQHEQQPATVADDYFDDDEDGPF